MGSVVKNIAILLQYYWVHVVGYLYNLLNFQYNTNIFCQINCKSRKCECCMLYVTYLYLYENNQRKQTWFVFIFKNWIAELKVRLSISSLIYGFFVATFWNSLFASNFKQVKWIFFSCTHCQCEICIQPLHPFYFYV